MSFYTIDEEQFVKKINSIKEDAIRNSKVTLLRFLNTREVELIKYICGHDVCVYFSSVTDEDEYRRGIISPFELVPDFKLMILKLEYNKKYLKPNHRMILGALMSYGITRDSIGDIYIMDNDDVYIVATKEIYPYLVEEFRILSHQSITLNEVDRVSGNVKHDYDIKTDFVASLRLDLIIASRFKLSRNDAQDLIKEGRCKVNQKPIDNTSHMLKESDNISLKGFGKMKILEVGGLSKNNKIYVKLAKLI